MGTDRRRELRRGLARTRRYLLAHHPPAEFDRCHALAVGDRRVHVCARCSGVYPGIAVGATLALAGMLPALWPWLVAVGPAPALVDWAATTLGERVGTNGVRTVTGALLGLAYGVAAVQFLTDPRAWLVGIAVVYGILAVLGLWVADTEPASTDPGPVSE
jgi:uncharacterized membrane protein